MATPQVIGPDGVSRTTLRFTTSIGARFFTGTMDSNTVDMEMSIDGGAYSNNADYITFDGTSWTVPDPEVFPDGLELSSGENAILIRSISSAGAVSSPASIVVTLVSENVTGVVALPPTNVSLEQLDGRVSITVDAPADTVNFRGINIYASLYEGGGLTGYSKLNINAVDSGVTVEELSSIGTIDIESTVKSNGDGTHVADPQYAEFTGTQVDIDGVVLQEDFSDKIEIPETASKIRTSIVLSSIRTITQYSFDHYRGGAVGTITIGAFAAAPVTDPLFYVTTAVYYDPVTLVEVESSFSIEVVGHPLTVTSVIGTFPIVSRQQIIRNTIESIFRSNPQVRVDPGSALRDTFIDPFSSEAERLRFIVDFLHRVSSFAGLLAVDDPASSGASAPVGTSVYKLALKKAFGLTKDTDVQAVIDRAIESLASNLGVFRRAGRFARGEVILYTTKKPTSTILIPLGTTVGGGSVQFRVLSPKSLPFEELGRFFDPITGRYQVVVSVQATTVGSAGNIAAGQVRKVISGATGLSVVNTGSMFGGTDQETNLELATRAQNALASVDSGTARGYLQTVADVPGVIQAEVVSAGDAIMERDLDSSGVHRGGKVDIWVQGENLATVTDTFSFAREVAKDIHFVIVGDPLLLIFRAIDERLSVGTPIVEMLDDETQSLGLRNATTGDFFDLTGVTITSFDTIQLSTDVVQPSVTLSDVVFGDYRRLTGNTYALSRQPVQELLSITGTLSGLLPSSIYRLVHPNDPLELGRSSLAEDYIEITSISDGAGGFIPSGEPVQVFDEAHILIGEYPEFLDSIGADPLTIVVKSADGLTTYRGPNDPSGISDYTIIDGAETVPFAIQRIPTGDILSGASVIVSYQHDENFTVSYTVNVIVSVAQEAVDAKRHVTADVLVKEGVNVPVDIVATIVLIRGSVQSTVNNALRTNLANLFQRFRLGDPVRQSDVVGMIEATPGVSYVELPLTTMVRQEGSSVVREALSTDQTGDLFYISAWSNSIISVWLLRDALSSATTNGGGPVEEFRGVFQDDVAITLILSSPSTVLKTASGQAYIIGFEGLSIPGISDDATLIAEGYISSTEIVTQRKVLTANRILVSSVVDDAPTYHSYTVTYIVAADSSVRNIETSKAEYLSLGNLEFTFDEDR